ncbi:MAG: hypothetical protein IID31_14450 [Planctomycetes bacterium]|nr:hypothetical protein [Planctomycetota bacterium]
MDSVWTGVGAAMVTGAIAALFGGLVGAQMHKSRKIGWPVAVAIVGGFILLTVALFVTASRMR